MATLRGKNPKNSKKLHVITGRGNKLVILVAILLLAGVGSYLVFSSQASVYSGNVNGLTDNGIDSNGNLVPPGSIIDGQIYVSSGTNGANTPPSSAYVLLAYNPKHMTFVGSTCKWQLGCTIKVGDDLYYASIPSNTQYHPSEQPREIYKAQIFYCFDVKARPQIAKGLAATYQFKRTNHVPVGDEAPRHEWKIRGLGQKQGSCADNPNFEGVLFHSRNACGAENTPDYPKCNGLSDPGAGSAILTGFGGGGNGNGGEGSGNNGVGTGSGPGPGGGAGGGGSSANRQADKPNSLPTPSPQGTNTEQAELEPDPFFDGKDFEKGSDSDNLVFGNSTIGNKKVPKILLFLLSAILLGGAGGSLYWRWKRKA